MNPPDPKAQLIERITKIWYESADLFETARIEAIASAWMEDVEKARHAAEIERLETGKHVAFQIIDGVSPHALHASFVERLVQLALTNKSKEG